MKNILNKFFKFNNISLPSVVRRSFNEKFGDSINAEWLQTEDFYEAIFYSEDVEHIARFDSTGNLLNLKKNLTLHAIPEQIRIKAISHGEIMNIIEIKEEEIVGYELIVRDEELIRYSLLLNDKGGLIHKSKL